MASTPWALYIEVMSDPAAPPGRSTTVLAVALSIVLVSAIVVFAVYSKHRRAEILAADVPQEISAIDGGAPVEGATEEPVSSASGVTPPRAPRTARGLQPPPPSGPPDSRGCYKPAPPEQLPTTPEVAVMVDALSRAVAEGYWHVDAGKPTDTPEKMAADLKKRLNERAAHPTGRLQSCLERTSAVRMANPKRPLIQCIHTIDVCADDRGGPGCCPRACIELAHRLCAGGKCDDPGREIFILQKLWSGECVAGFAEALAPLNKMNEEAALRGARQQRAMYAFVHAGASGAVVANRPDGLVRSTDDGRTWTAINAGLETADVRVVAEGPSGRLYAIASGQIFRLGAGERRWQSVDFRMLQGPQYIQQILVDGAGRFIVHDGTLAWVSPDEGVSWRRLPETAPRAIPATIALSADGRLLTGAHGDSPLARWRGVDAWDLLPLGTRIGSVQHIWPLPDGRMIVEANGAYLIGADGVVVSPAPPPEPPKGVIHTRELRYLQAVGGGHGSIYAIRAQASEPLLRSSDGVLWTPIRTVPGCGEPTPGERRSCDVRGLAVTRRGTVILAANQRLLRSADGGETWTVVRENE